MKKQNPKIQYDKESEVLSLSVSKAKSVDSDIRGNVVIDYDKKGAAVRVNVYNFNLGAFRESRKELARFAKNRKALLLAR